MLINVAMLSAAHYTSSAGLYASIKGQMHLRTTGTLLTDWFASAEARDGEGTEQCQWRIRNWAERYSGFLSTQSHGPAHGWPHWRPAAFLHPQF